MKNKLYNVNPVSFEISIVDQSVKEADFDKTTQYMNIDVTFLYGKKYDTYEEADCASIICLHKWRDAISGSKLFKNSKI